MIKLQSPSCKCFVWHSLKNTFSPAVIHQIIFYNSEKSLTTTYPVSSSTFLKKSIDCSGGSTLKSSQRVQINKTFN